MDRARALSTKMNNDRAEGHCFIAFPEFNDLGRSVIPNFLFRNRLNLFTIISTLSKNEQKINVGN